MPNVMHIAVLATGKFVLLQEYRLCTDHVKCKIVPLRVMKACGIVEEKLHSHGNEWLISRPGPFIPRERAPCSRGIGGWLGCRAGLDALK
jgi:hypothetical protein